MLGWSVRPRGYNKSNDQITAFASSFFIPAYRLGVRWVGYQDARNLPKVHGGKLCILERGVHLGRESKPHYHTYHNRSQVVNYESRDACEAFICSALTDSNN